MRAGQKSVEPRQEADSRERPYVLPAVVALGYATAILGVFLLPTDFFAILLWAPFTALIAGGFACALRPTWGRFLGGLGGLVLGCVVAILAWGETIGEDLGANLLVVLAFVTPAFVIGYAIVGALRVLEARR